MTTTDLMQTLGNPGWIKENEQRLKSIFPKTWTHINNLNGLQSQVRALVGEQNNHRVTITLSEFCSAKFKAVPQTGF